MNDLIRTNFKKLKFTFLFISIIFGFLTSILIAVAAFSNQFPDFNLLLAIALGSLIALPLFIFIIAILAWFVKYKQQRRFFNHIMESHLLPMGFHQEISNLKSRWKFADEVYKLENEGRKIVMSQNNHKTSEIEFIYFKNVNHLNPKVEKIFKMNKVDIKNMSAENLKSFLLKNTFN